VTAAATPRGPAFVDPPARIPFLFRAGIWIAERVAGERLLLARLLTWYPRAALGAGVLEATIANRDGRIDARVLKLVRLAASLATACPFCVDMNSARHREVGVTDAELAALREQADPDTVPTLSELERLAIRYARLLSATPLRFDPGFVEQLQRRFDEREIVVLATTAAQVNYWARLAQALGVPPATDRAPAPGRGREVA
jgi:AhpD family alkylhydroperoxidase